MLCSDSPACCELIQKIVQDRRKERGQDQSQDPNGFGVYLCRAGNDHKTGKSDNTRHSTHSKSNNHPNDNLLHDIPFSACDLQKAEPLPYLRHRPRPFYKIRLVYLVGMSCFPEQATQFHSSFM